MLLHFSGFWKVLHLVEPISVSLFAPAIQEACMSSDAQGQRRNCTTQSYTKATCAKQPFKVRVTWISTRLSTRCWRWILYASPTVNQRPKRMLWAETSCLCQRYRSCFVSSHHDVCFLLVSLLQLLMSLCTGTQQRLRRLAILPLMLYRWVWQELRGS